MISSGLYTALITPFRDGQVDYEALRKLLTLQREAHIDGIVIGGSTGEGSTLKPEEKKRIVELAKETCPNLPIMLSVGTSITESSVENAQLAASWGADVAFLAAPYFNKPTQEGLYQHFSAVARSSPIPLVLYNIPSRCGVNIERSTFERLLDIPNIIGIKESPSDVRLTQELLCFLKKKRPDILIFAGDDQLALPMHALGADGLISVASNLFPEKMRKLVHESSLELHNELFPLFQMLFVETNPIPLKAAMNHLGLPAGDLRLPLTPLSEAAWAKLKPVLESVKAAR